LRSSQRGRSCSRHPAGSAAREGEWDECGIRRVVQAGRETCEADLEMLSATRESLSITCSTSMISAVSPRRTGRIKRDFKREAAECGPFSVSLHVNRRSVTVSQPNGKLGEGRSVAARRCANGSLFYIRSLYICFRLKLERNLKCRRWVDAHTLRDTTSGCGLRWKTPSRSLVRALFSRRVSLTDSACSQVSAGQAQARSSCVNRRRSPPPSSSSTSA